MTSPLAEFSPYKNIKVFGTLGLRILNISKKPRWNAFEWHWSGRNSQRPTALEAWFLGVNSMQRRSKSGRLWVVSFPKVWRWELKPGLFPWKIHWFYVGQQSTLTSIFIEFPSYCTLTCLLDSNSLLVISLGEGYNNLVARFEGGWPSVFLRVLTIKRALSTFPNQK